MIENVEKLAGWWRNTNQRKNEALWFVSIPIAIGSGGRIGF